jgi:hypothetical protein
MAITFTWSVNDMHKVTATGAVYIVEWNCSGTDADTSVSHSRSGSYLHTNDDGVQATPDHTAAGFIAYASLTEANALDWVKADGEGARTEALITSNITNKISDAATNSIGMPW